MSDDGDNDFQHYRSIAIGFTAPVLAISLIELQYVYAHSNDFNENVNFLVFISGIIILTILLCIVLQGLIFAGYLYKARKQYKTEKQYLPDPNKWFFGPADELVVLIFITFLIGTICSIPPKLGGWNLGLIVACAGVILYTIWRKLGLVSKVLKKFDDKQ